MQIDNTLRKRWGLIPNQSNLSVDEEGLNETDIVSSSIQRIDLGNRFHATAQEWLTTWRMVE